MTTVVAQTVPLAPPQRGIYFLHRIAPDSAVYNVPIALHVLGGLDRERLQRAVDALLDRHQALRTTIVERDGEPVQVIHPPADAPQVTVAWSNVDGTVEAAAAAATRRAEQPFDLRIGPLWRVAVVEIAPAEHALVFAFHHVIIDEVSAAVIARELRILYTDPAALDAVAPEHGYADFCLSQQGGPDPAGLEYWRGQLAGLESLGLPDELVEAGRGLFTGDRVLFTVPEETAELLTEACRKHRVSAFMAFYAALDVLLHRWTGQTDLAVGTPMAGRTDDRFAETVGFFQNTVVLRTAVAGDATFSRLLKAHRRTVLEALQHQGTPFEAVVELARPSRDGARNPLFQAALVYNRVKVEEEWQLDGLDVRPLPFIWHTSHFDLTLSMVLEAGVLKGEFAYSAHRFSRETIEELVTAFTSLLDALLREPDRPVGDVPFRAPAPRGQAPGPAVAVEQLDRRPRTPEEEILCGLFSELLGIPDLGIDDHFFDLGGHSLLATQLIVRVRAVLDAELGVLDLFEAPTVAGLVDRLTTAWRTRLVPATRPAVVPLSYAQRGLWFLNRLEGPSPTYNIPLVLRLTGELDRGALRAALADVTCRHESLRTVFPEVAGEARQLVLDQERSRPALELVEVDPAGLDARLDDAARYAFELTTEPPLRAWLFATGPDEHVLLLLVHHIASDGWSLGPLGRDLATAYAARCAGQAPEWAPLPVQYADYTLWQQSTLGAADDPGSALAGHLAFWRDTLAGLPDELALPTDRPRPTAASHRGALLPVEFDSELHDRVVAFARDAGVTVFMVVQAAFAALCNRLGAGTDIAVGTASAGRGDAALDELVGFFVNTLVLRTDTAGDPTFRQLVERVRRADLAAYAHQDVPFELVVEAVNPPRSLARHPLFQVMVNLQRNVVGELGLPGLRTEIGQTPQAGVSKFDLSLNLQEFYDPDGAPAGIQGVAEYATDLFDAGTIDALLGRLARVLDAAVTAPDRPIGQLDVLSPDERHRLLVEWNGAEREVPETVLPLLFEVQAAATPDAPALTCDGAVLTYAELNARANALARTLITRGVGPERLVAVAIPRSVELVVALLAVVKAGGAYVPIDTAYAAGRIASMLRDSDPALVLTTGPVALPSDVDSLAIGGEGTEENVTDVDRLAPLTPDHAAYVIYTSGSTGQPKGVVVEHRSLTAYLAWARDAYPGLDGPALVHSPVSFDLTVTGLFGTLTAGGCVHLAELAETPGTTPERPAFLKATPSHLPLLAALPETYSPTRTLMLGGEQLLGEAVQDWRDRHPGATVINEYGPTETTVGCTVHEIGPGEAVAPGPVPIGRPIWNTRIYLLDAAREPVPVGAPGELYIAGPLVARGYLNRPELTAERFVPDPFGPPDGRMYRSGDLARWNGDGQLEYLGRADDQVKLRGYRIEPGEIETVLTGHPAVERAAVVVREDRPGDRRLVAYVTGAAPDHSQLRAHLAERVPAYLVPSAFVTLDALQLTPNGKLDRAALPAPETSAGMAGRPPRTDLEQRLCALFADVLGMPAVGVEDGFFDLGGHSLLAVRLAVRIEQDLGWAVPVGTLIGNPTVEALAALLADAPMSAGVVRLREADGDTTVALIHPVGGTLLCYADLVRQLPETVAAVGCERLPGAHPADASLDDLADRYAAALAAAVPDRRIVVGGWSLGGVLAHAVAGRLSARGCAVAGVALLDALAPRVADDRERLAGFAAILRGRGDNHEELLAGFGVDLASYRSTPPAEAAALLDDWADLLELAARYEPAPVDAPARLFLCADNPAGYPERIAASWAGLHTGLAIERVPGDHFALLQPPAVASIAGLITDV